MFQYMETMLPDYLNKLKNKREQRGITQRELSRMSGVSYSTLTKLESGIIKNPSFIIIYKITKALDLMLDEIMD